MLFIDLGLLIIICELSKDLYECDIYLFSEYVMFESNLNSLILRKLYFFAAGSPLDCDFERGLCGYTQSQSDNFDWTRHQGTTLSSNTGPLTDHTFKNDTGK